MIRLLFFIGAGILLGSGIVSVIGAPGAAGWSLPTGMGITITTGVLLLMGRSMRGMQTPSTADIDDARAAGRLALVRIDSLTQTGTQINDQPVCDLEVSVQPLEGEAFRTRIRRIVQITEIPAVQPGRQRAAALLTADGPEVALLADDPTLPPYASLVVPPLEQLGEPRLPEPGTQASRGGRRGPIIGIGRRGRGWRYLLFAVALLVSAALVVLPYRTAFVQSLGALTQGRLTADLREPGSIRTVISELSERIGHDSVVDILVSENFVIVEAPAIAGDLATDRWQYRGGQITDEGPATIQPDNAREQFSLSEIHWNEVWAGVQSAARDEGIGDLGDLSISARRGTVSDIDSEFFGEAVGPVQVSFWFDGEYEDAYYVMNPDGSDLRRTG